MCITQRASLLFAALAVLVLAASPALAGQEPPQKPAQAQAQPIEGELVKVDTNAKMLTVKPASGAEVHFEYNDSTEISGAKDAAGLATLKQSKVTVHYREDPETKSKLATRIIVQPAKQ